MATELFIRNGYHGVSYLGIGKELGITHSNVHYYYRTKAALAEAVLKRVAKETLQATEGIWYKASGHELRGRGIMATWTAEGRPPTECRAVD